MLKLWLKTKYQAHRTTITDSKGKEKQEYVTPEMKPDDLILAEWHKDGHQPEPRFLADRFRISFGKLLEMIAKAKLEDNGRRRTIILHLFRRFTKTTISSQGYAAILLGSLVAILRAWVKRTLSSPKKIA